VKNSLRAAWLVIALLPGAVGAQRATDISPWVVWIIWALVGIAVLVPHPLSLTMIRFFAPMLMLHTAWRVATSSDPLFEAGDRNWGTVAGLVILVAASATAFFSRYGALHAQAAAYGHEVRHMLRPPVAVLAPLALLWMLVAVAAAVATYASSLPIAVGALIVASALASFSLRRSLVLARRWLVFVPAGIAVHDPLVLRDTFMVRSHDVRGLRIAKPGTEAFDATCTSWGQPLELVLSHPHDVSLSEFGARIKKTLDRLHVTSLLVAPSRPEQALKRQAGQD
jgi:hypothetical protein